MARPVRRHLDGPMNPFEQLGPAHKLPTGMYVLARKEAAGLLDGTDMSDPSRASLVDSHSQSFRSPEYALVELDNLETLLGRCKGGRPLVFGWIGVYKAVGPADVADVFRCGWTEPVNDTRVVVILSNNPCTPIRRERPPDGLRADVDFGSSAAGCCTPLAPLVADRIVEQPA
jgi:hypothetical protein